uniref:Putative secreted peptide n=1 Tax=Anopheles braziliensis TaxID=58242 RepID=A0A2M3ZUV3_9DIPT
MGSNRLPCLMFLFCNLYCLLGQRTYSLSDGVPSLALYRTVFQSTNNIQIPVSLYAYLLHSSDCDKWSTTSPSQGHVPVHIPTFRLNMEYKIYIFLYIHICIHVYICGIQYIFSFDQDVIYK